MPLISEMMTGGSPRRYAIGGQCFSLVNSPSGLASVQLLRNGMVFEDIQGPLQAGFHWEAGRYDFDAVDLVPLATEKISVFIGAGKVTAPSDSSKPPGITGFFSSAGIVFNTSEVIFSAAANVNGAVVRHAEHQTLWAGSSTAQAAWFVAAPTAPTGIPLPADSIVLCGNHASGGPSNFSLGHVDDVFVPAGLGLYFLVIGSNLPAYGLNYRAVGYTLQ